MQARTTVARQVGSKKVLFVSEQDLVGMRYHGGVNLRPLIATSYGELTHYWLLEQHRLPNTLTLKPDSFYEGELVPPFLDVRFTLKTTTAFTKERVLISERAIVLDNGSRASSEAVGEVLARIGEGMSAVPGLRGAHSRNPLAEADATAAAERLTAAGFKIVLVVELLFDSVSFVHPERDFPLAAPRVRIGDFRLETLRLGVRDFTVLGSDGGRLSLSRSLLHATNKFFRHLLVENPMLSEFVFEYPLQTVNIVLVYMLTRCFLGPATFENVDGLFELARRLEVVDFEFTLAIDIDLMQIVSEKASDAVFLLKLFTTPTLQSKRHKLFPNQLNMVKSLLVKRHFATLMRDFVADSTNAERRQLAELLDRPMEIAFNDYSYRMYLQDEKRLQTKDIQLFVFNK